ncbi:MAG: glycine cleavage system aminomethyltransferase GcvT [Pseudomonadota bacterium]
MGQKTPLYEAHVAAGARMVDFGGWDMPLNYGSQLTEHEAVRSASGVFDVSHMTVVDVSGADAEAYMRTVFANDVARLRKPGRALYGCLLNEAGGIVDDLIVYRCGDADFRLVVNAATRDKDLGWLAECAANVDVAILERADLAMLAVQGPDARSIAADLIEIPDLMSVRRFGFERADDVFVARTGYTGEDGFEIIVPEDVVGHLWQQLLAADVAPCGLGARDSLRLEAGLGLYGSDMTDATHPYECNLGWTVDTSDPDRHFIGRDALAKVGDGERVLTGLVLPSGGVLRAGQRVITDAGDGVITSGGFSPTLKVSVALARTPRGADVSTVRVEIRNKTLNVHVVEPPFVRGGAATFSLS